MLKDKMNEVAYRNQRIALDNLAKEFDLVIFRPKRHREDNNITFFYTKKEMRANIDNLWNQEYEPRLPLWTFENTDANGKFSYRWANKGLINLRGFDCQSAIRDGFLDYIDRYNDSKANI